MNARVTVINGKEKLSVEVDLGQDVAALKQCLSDKHGLPSGMRLLHKGKALGDEDTLTSAGLKNNAKVMMLLSADSHKQLEEKRKLEIEEKCKLEMKEAALEAQRMREGSGPPVAPPESRDKPPPQKEKEVIVCDDQEGSTESTAFVVIVQHGKRKFQASMSGSSTFGDIKNRLEGTINVPSKQQKLLFKGKQRENKEKLGDTGVKAKGSKMMLLFAEGWHVELEAKDDAASIRNEMDEAEKEVGKVLSKVQHRFMDHVELSIAVGRFDDLVYRLNDNVVHVKGAAEEKAELKKRAEALTCQLEELRRLHLEGIKRS
jgi:hypothetical protein